MELRSRRILLGVTGGIAAFKAATLVSLLRKEGAEVQVVMTENATRFITPLTLATLSTRPVLCDLFDCGPEWKVDHIDLADFAELALIAPATANIIGKTAAAVADDLLSTLLLALRCPVVFCPAMNSAMYRNPVLQDKITYLESKGYFFIPPVEGELACGDVGIGRLPLPENIINSLKALPLPEE